MSSSTAAGVAVAAPAAGRRRVGTPKAAAPKGGALSRRYARWGWAFAGPAALHILIWTGIPIVVAIVLGFTDWRVTDDPVFIGVDNYIEIFQDGRFWTSMWHNFYLALIGVPLSMLIALILAVMLNQAIRGVSVFRTAVFLPHVTATVAIAMIWLWIYAPDQHGLLNLVIGAFGLSPQAWLNSIDLALNSVLLVTIWQGIGLKMMIYLASLQGVDQQLYEAADVDGASTVQKFIHVTLPMLKPATFFVLVTSIIGNFQTFDLIYNMTQGGPADATSVVTWQIYTTAFQKWNVGLASAQSIVLLVVLLVITLISRKAIGDE